MTFVLREDQVRRMAMESLMAGGGISTARAIRAALARKPAEEDAFMEKLMLRLDPATAPSSAAR